MEEGLTAWYMLFVAETGVAVSEPYASRADAQRAVLEDKTLRSLCRIGTLELRMVGEAYTLDQWLD